MQGLRLLTFALVLAALPTFAQSPQTPTTAVLVMLSVKPEIPRERIRAVLPEEVRETVQLYLNGKIRQWYSRGDGKGVVFILDCREVSEARSIMEGLPLAKGHLVNLEFTPLAPLAPLGVLLGNQAPRP